MEETAYDGKATTSLALGIAGLIAWLIPLLGAPVTIIGLNQGFKGLNSSRRGNAQTGVTLCIIGLVLTMFNVVWGVYLGVTGQFRLANAIHARMQRH
jgi:hypothetical protein